MKYIHHTCIYTSHPITIEVGSKLFDSLAGFINEVRDKINYYKTDDREKFSDSDYKN